MCLKLFKILVKNPFFSRHIAQKIVILPSTKILELIESGNLIRDKNQLSIIKILDLAFNDVSQYNRNLWSKPPKGLYIYGSVGSGKTMLMDIFYDCCHFEFKRKAHFNEFMQDIHARFHSLKGAEHNKDLIGSVASQIAKESWLLCFDEFQVTDIADAMILKQLFTRLLEEGVVLFATSNRAPDDLYAQGLNRSQFLGFIPILKEHCRVINLDSKIDYRSQNEDGGNYYFIDDDGAMDKLFADLAQKESAQIEPHTVNFSSRAVIFPESCGGVLNTNFPDLCDTPLGAADYLKLAAIFHTILLRKVPILDLNQINQLRRFVQLIDIMYSKKIRLAVSAADIPDRLLSKTVQKKREDVLKSENGEVGIVASDEEIFAFRRTVSRLKEMRTKSYWSK